ncbi:MAG: hypothetical protein KGJ89_05645 [Patescibacteria group bacterium]|nr:hypothetical protein [Patescibacteria group bacterium]
MRPHPDQGGGANLRSGIGGTVSARDQRAYHGAAAGGGGDTAASNRTRQGAAAALLPLPLPDAPA